MNSPTCSTSSRIANEQLLGTATRADYWFLLEHNHPFGAKALPESNLPVSVKEKLEAAVAEVPNGRVQFIKRGGRVQEQGVSFFVVVNHEEQPNLYEFRLDRPEDILDLDLRAITAEHPHYRSHDRTDPLFLVCTNGKRDRCCASLGLPLYRTMRAQFGDAVWEVSHIGGHRFSPTLVTLPSGAYYGYVGPESAAAIVEATRAGQLHLPNFRGRSCYAPHVQAADTFLRRHTGNNILLQYKLLAVEELQDHVRMFHFRDRRTSEDCCVRVRTEVASLPVLKSCSDQDPTPLDQYRLEEIRIYRN